MLWPALRAHSVGKLSDAQVTWLRERFGLTEGPRTEGPAADGSLAHRRLTDEQGVPLVLDLTAMERDGWLFTLFQVTADKPTADFVAKQRAEFRAAIDHLGLKLLEIEPAATADEVSLVTLSAEDEQLDAFDGVWDLPDDLNRIWFHLGLLRDSPREVQEVKLRHLMRTSGWRQAPERVRRQAQEFLDGRWDGR
ncbi:MAG TPA: hypothetical protein VFH76_12405 [Kribbella sp.]|nr:hypothetical protein [Kribbella sp.]